MANKTIPDLPELTPITEETLFLADSGTQSFKVKASTLRKRNGLGAYDSAVSYSQNDLVASSGVVYRSLANSNAGNALTDGTKWVVFGGIGATKTTTYSMLITDDIVRLDTTSGSFTATLPTIASSYGKQLSVKWVDNGSSNAPTVKGNGSELIETANTLVMNSPGDVIKFWNNGTNWEIL